ncbi:MAG: SgcJ/EcaC family oxidoreductase [Thermoplasmata archaeon]|nr:SgcJ/EcaC family oxidoreductase [Thermoplasmata archaeon]
MVEGERAIRALVAEFRAGWNAHDAARLSAVFAEDADFTNYRGDQAHGRVGVRAFHASVFEGIFRETVLAIDGLRIRPVREGIASVDVWCSMSGASSREGGLRPPYRELVSLLVTRNESGPWQILVFHSQDLPRSAPGPA